jgi:hypothetical protein
MECDGVLPGSMELDGVPTPRTTEVTTSTKADTIKTEVESVADVEVLAGAKDDIGVNVMVVKPFVETSAGQRSDAGTECMDVEEEGNHLSSGLKLQRKSNQQFEMTTNSNLEKGPDRNKDRHFPKVKRQSKKDSQARTSLESRKDLQAQTLESEVCQDGQVLKLKISRIKPASSTKVLSSQKLSPRKNISGLEELLLPKQIGGHPVKRVFSSTYKEKGSSGRRTRRRKSSSSVSDESWTPSKMSRTSSVDSDCDRYRELRDRNNEASRKSRQNRKARESDMKEAAAKLERENQSLKVKADEMERLVKKLRQALLEAVIKTKKE